MSPAGRVPLADRFMLLVLAAAALAGWLAVILSEVGWLGPVAVLAGVSAMLAMAHWVSRGDASRPDDAPPEAPGSARPLLDGVIIVALVLASVALYSPAIESTFWASDATLYLSTGRQVGETGAWLFRDPLLEGLPADARAEMFTNRFGYDMTGDYARFPGGLAIPDIDGTRVAAGFSPLFPVLLAVSYQLFGSIESMLAVPLLFSVLAVCTVFLIGRLLDGRLLGVFAALLLLVCMPQIWFTRLPMSEVVAQFYALGGLLALMHALRGGDRRCSWIAGVAFGAAGLAAFDLLPVIGWALVVAMAIALIRGRPVSPVGWTLAVLGIAMLHAAAHYALFPSNYRRFVVKRLDAAWLMEGLRRSLQGGAVLLWLIFAAGLVAASLVALRRVSRREGSTARQQLGVGFLAAALLWAVAYLLVVPGLEGSTVRWLGWYLSWPALIVLPFALADRARLAWRRPGDGAGLLLVCLFAAAAVHQLHNPQDQDFGTQLWTMRRFVPLLLPLASLLVVTGVFRAARRVAHSSAVATVAVLPLLILAARPSVAVVRQPFWQDGVAQGRAIAAIFPDTAVVLVSQDLAGTHVQTALDYLFDVDTVLLQSRYPAPSVWGQQLTRWTGDGRRVFLMVGAVDTHLAVPGLSLRRHAHPRLQVRALETTTDRVPRRAIDLDAVLDTYELEMSGADTASSVDIGDYRSDGCFRIEGFHGPELDSAGDGTFRWTDLRATIEVPAAPVYRIQVGAARPPGVAPANLEVLLDGRRVGVFQLPTGVVELRIDNPSVGTGMPVLLELQVPTFNPRALGISDDARNLGVRLYNVDWSKTRD
jgi:hypothetical protein